MTTARDIREALAQRANPRKAVFLQRFFKTGPGEYAEGDRFIGVTVPQIRQVVRAHSDSPLSEVVKLLKSPIHEERLAAVLLLGLQFKHGDQMLRGKIYRAYLAHTRYVNNWDLVDSSAPYIVGEYLIDRPRGVLDRLARSRLLWDRRVAIVATFAFIKRDDFKDALRIARQLLQDEHDLIHKAVGWMLREVGKRNPVVLRTFLNRQAHRMPRTALRYALEKLPPAQKKRYMRQTAPQT